VKDKLVSQLAYLVGNKNNVFDNPFDDTIETNTIHTDDVPIIKDQQKPKKQDKYTKILSKCNELIDDFSDNEIFLFDDYLDNHFGNDEDVTLRNNLISMGRKYNRDSSVSPEVSEITKTFSANEKALSGLLDELMKDKESIHKDIMSIRTSRIKNYRTLSELIEAKNQIYSTSLNVIKESNSVKKAQIDLQNKVNAKKAENDGEASVSNRAISGLFGIGRGNIMSSIGGYEAITGSSKDNNNQQSSVNNININTNDLYIDDDELIQKKYFSNEKDEDDGDKFLKYESMGVEYVLLVSNDGTNQVIAEDRDGNIIHDYPMPTNIGELTFDISPSTNTATDNYHRKYKVRNIDEL